MNFLKEFARYFTGAVFIFSGLIKVNDPVGTAIKLEEYFEVFAYDFAPFFEWFIPGALIIAVIFVVAEVLLGVALVLGYEMKWTSWALIALIVFFTFLTFYSAYFNKVTDCGCFGDAIKLTPWQSFSKDLILLATSIIILVNRKKYTCWMKSLHGHVVVGVSTILFLLVSVYAINHLPFVDFRTYAIGNNLPELMRPSGELKYEYVMKKDGKEVTLENYPSDPSFEFVEMNVLNPEVQPKITDLAIWNDDGDFTESLMNDGKLLIITHNIGKTSVNHNEEIRTLIEATQNIDTWALTSSDGEAFRIFADQAKWQIPFFYADATVLKTIVRSSPGIVLIKNGTVLGKWHHNDTPSASEIHRLLKL
jgi:uncharacterized membrane protein YphA (DoxX/SURF4 family)